jgi:hypothetical protein
MNVSPSVGHVYVFNVNPGNQGSPVTFSAPISLFTQVLCVGYFMCCCMLYFVAGSWNVNKICVPIICVNDIIRHIILGPSKLASIKYISFPVQGVYLIHRSLFHFRTLVIP